MRVTTLVSAASLLAVVCIFMSLFITRIYHIAAGHSHSTSSPKFYGSPMRRRLFR